MDSSVSALSYNKHLRGGLFCVFWCVCFFVFCFFLHSLSFEGSQCMLEERWKQGEHLRIEAPGLSQRCDPEPQTRELSATGIGACRASSVAQPPSKPIPFPTVLQGPEFRHLIRKSYYLCPFFNGSRQRSLILHKAVYVLSKAHSLWAKIFPKSYKECYYWYVIWKHWEEVPAGVCIY